MMTTNVLKRSLMAAAIGFTMCYSSLSLASPELTCSESNCPNYPQTVTLDSAPSSPQCSCYANDCIVNNSGTWSCTETNPDTNTYSCKCNNTNNPSNPNAEQRDESNDSKPR